MENNKADTRISSDRLSSNRLSSNMVSSGVEELIDKLRSDGIEAGKNTAATLIAQAESEAARIHEEVKQQAEKIISEARLEAQRLQKGGEDALNIAMRDIVLKLKAKLNETVSERVKKLISTELAKEELLRELILEIAGKARKEADLDTDNKIKMLLPAELVGLEELREHPLELEEGSLSHFILNVASDVLREGVSFGVSEDGKHGLRIHLEEKDIVIDLSDERIAELLLEHLQPRFRAILEGMVK